MNRGAGTTWRVGSDAGRLVVHRPDGTRLALRPLERDLFAASFNAWFEDAPGLLQFHRDAAGEIVRLEVSTPPGMDPARGVAFVRLPPH